MKSTGVHGSKHITVEGSSGSFPLGGIFLAEQHFPLENVMSMRSGLLLCVKFPQKNS